MATRIQLRRDTAAAWTAANPVLAQGEVGLELVTGQFKVGDGVTAWNALGYGGIVGPAGPPGGVTTFEGRAGVVVSANGDYTASEITNVPAGNITTATVQLALNELDTLKLAASHAGTGGTAHAQVTTIADGFMIAADKTKLDGIASGATANQTDAYLLSRANHTGTQASTTISDFAEAVDDRVAALVVAGTGITATYNDGANTLTIDNTLTQYTDELAQDSVGNILVDSASVDFTYNDATPSITAVVLPAGVDHNSLANLTTGDPHTQYALESSLATVATSGQHSDLTGSGTNTHAQIDTHIANSGIHFTQGSIDHTAIANIGTNSHATIDSHIADSTIHFTQASISIPSAQINDFSEAVDDRVNGLLVAGTGINLTYNDGLNTLTIDGTSAFTSEDAQDAAAAMLTAGTHDGISTSYNDAGNAYSLTNTDKGSTAVSAHAGTNTHTQIDTHIADTSIHFAQASIDHGSIAGLGDDDHTQYHNDTRGDARYFQKTEHLNVSAGAGDAGKPIKLDAGGHVDATMINDGDISHLNISDIGTNSHAAIDSHIADSTIHFTQGSISIPSTQISDFTEAAQDSSASMFTSATHDGVSVSYSDAGNTLAITNTDKGSTAVSTHTGLSDPHTQYVLAAGDTITGLITDTKVGDQFIVNNGSAKVRTGSVPTLTSGNLYTTTGSVNATYLSSNFAIDSSGNFASRDATGNCFLLTYSADGTAKYYIDTVTTGVPSFTGSEMRFSIDLPNSKLSTGANTFTTVTDVADGASAVGFIQKTNNSIVTTGSKVWSLQNNTSEVAFIAGTGASVYGSFGAGSTVSGGWSFGSSNTVSGSYTTAFGFGNTVSGNGTAAIGLSNNASSLYSFCAGYGNTSSGAFSVAIGNTSKAENTYAVAIGSSVRATSNKGLGIGSDMLVTGGMAIGQFATGFQQTTGGAYAFGFGQHYPAMKQERTRSVTLHDTTRFFVGDSASLSGSELVTNGTFTGGSTGWTITGTSWSYSANTMISSGAVNGDTITQTISGLVIGQVYRLSFDISNVTVDGTKITPSLATSGITFTARQLAQTTVRELFVARSTSEVLTFTTNGGATNITLDNVSIQKVTTGNISVPNIAYLNDITIGDARNITLNATTGTKIGTATTEKLGFWNATPIVQPANTAAIDDLLVSTGLRASGGTASFTSAISGPSININSGGAVSALSAGTYTPTLTNVTNVAASTAYQCQYMRIGNTVTVSGKIDIDKTASGAAEVGMSLPVASNFGAEEDCAGVGADTISGGGPGLYIKADAANDRASLNSAGGADGGNTSHYFTFTYQVI